MLHPIQPPSSFLSLLLSPTLLSFPGVAHRWNPLEASRQRQPRLLGWGSKVEKVRAKLERQTENIQRGPFLRGGLSCYYLH